MAKKRGRRRKGRRGKTCYVKVGGRYLTRKQAAAKKRRKHRRRKHKR